MNITKNNIFNQYSGFIFVIFLSISALIFSNDLLDDTQPVRFLSLSIVCSIFNFVLLFRKTATLRSPVFLGLLLLNLILSLISSINSIILSEAFYEISKIFFQLNIILISFQLFKESNFTFKKDNSIIPYFYLLVFFQLLVLVGVLYSINSLGLVQVLNGVKPYGGFFINPNLFIFFIALLF